MPTINIDGKPYDIDQLSDDAKKQIGSLQFVERRINELQAEIAAMQTARIAYGRALAEIISSSEADAASKVQ